MVRSFLHEDKNEETQKYFWSVKKGQEMTVGIRVADIGYYFSFLNNTEEEDKFKDTRIPPWAANWLTV
jgi:hypothetical protein